MNREKASKQVSKQANELCSQDECNTIKCECPICLPITQIYFEQSFVIQQKYE